MKKSIYIIIIILSLFLISCGEEELKVSKIEIANYTEIKVVEYNNFQLADFDLKVTFEDNTFRIIRLEANMMSEDDLKKFTQIGTHKVYISYKGAHTAFEFEVKELNKNIASLNIQLSNTEYVYTGMPICPSVAVYDDKTLLFNGINYTVEYLDNINAGIGIVQITGIGKYEGVYNAIFTINKADLIVKADDIVVEGSSIPEYTVSYEGFKYTDNEYSLSGNLLFECNYNSDVNGTYDIIPSGLTSNNYNIEFVKGSLTINRALIKESNVTLSNIVFDYTGSEIEPSVIVKVNDTIYSDENYRVQYLNNIDAGTGKVIITGKNALSGTVEKTFTINKVKLEVSVGNYEIYYLEDVPEFNVIYNRFVGDDSVYILDGKLEIGCDYDGNSVGEYPITLSGLSSNNYDIIYKNGSLKVKETKIDKLTLDIDKAIYTGKEIIPSIEVYKDDYKLTENDFIVSFSGNVNAGVATVTVKGVNNFTGELSKTFIIDKAKLEVSCNDVTCEYGSSVLNEESSFTYVINGFVNNESINDLLGNLVITNTYNGIVGEYDIIASGLSSNNYEISYQKGKLTVTQKEVVSSNVTLSETEFVYCGSEIKPQYEINIGNLVITKNDYTFEYSDNLNAGTGKLTITFNGNFTGTVVKEFTINKAKLTVTPKSFEVIYGGMTPKYDANISGFVGKDNLSNLTGSLNYNCQYTSSSNVGKYEVVVSGLSSNNYEITYEKGEVVVKEKSIDNGIVEIIEPENFIYVGKEITPSIKVTVDDKDLVLNNDYKVEYFNNINVGKASLKVTGINNYFGELEKEFVINKRDVEIKVNDISINYLETANNFEVTVSNLPENITVDEVKLALSYTCEYVKGNKPGSYVISVNGYNSDNLNISYVDGNLNVLVDNEFEGLGTIDSPYKVSSLLELYGLSLEVKKGFNFENKYFVLTNDIDFNGYNLETIGVTNFTFNGNFNGNGYKIKNVKVISDSPYTLGLFGEINNASISNLIIENISFDSTVKQIYVGVIAKSVNSSIDSIALKDLDMDILPVYDLTVGGIVGHLEKSVLTNSYVTGFIDIQKSSVSALCGAIASVVNSTVDSIYTNLNIVSYSDEITIGGIAAKVASSQISNSFVTGEIRLNGYICEVSETVCDVLDNYVLIENVLYSSDFEILLGNDYVNNGTDESEIINIMNSIWDLDKWLFIEDEQPVLVFESASSIKYVNKVDTLEMKYGSVYLDQNGYTINPNGQDILKAGTYEVTLTLKEGYIWSDDTKDSIVVTLNVIKKDLYININSLVINPGDTVNVTYTYNGLINSDLSLLNNLVFVHSYTGDEGTYEITLSNAFDNYNLVVTNGYIYAIGETNKWSLWDGTYQDGEFIGSGTEEDPYQINSANDLATLAYKANNNISTNYFYILNTNVDLNNINFPGIGNVVFEKYFNGVFDGNGYVISNLSIDLTNKSNNSFGLFGHIKDGKVMNLDVVNANISGSSFEEIYVGILAAFVDNSEILSSSVTGEINIDYHGYQSMFVGAFVSYVMSSSKLNNVYADTNIFINVINNLVSTRPFVKVSGLVSAIYDSTLEYGYSTGVINVISNDDLVNVGGLVAYGSNEVLKSLYSKVNINVFGNSALITSNATLSYTFDSFSDIIYLDNIIKVTDKEIVTDITENAGTKMTQEELDIYLSTNWDNLVWDLSDLSNPKLIK